MECALTDEISVRFACGCTAVLGSAERDPKCREHGERRINRVDAPPPRFRAVGCAVTGPHVEVSDGR